MRTIDIYAFPFQKGNELMTRLFIDSQEINNPDNRLTQYVVKKPMSKWLKSYKRKLFVWKGFLFELAYELNASDYTIIFHGRQDDFEVFVDEVLKQKVQLENEGRKISLDVIFKERFSPKRAVKVMTDAYDALIHKELTDGNFIAQDKIKYAKDSLTLVSCRVNTLGGMPKDFKKRLEKHSFINCNTTHPKVIAAIVGTDWSGDIGTAVSDMLKGQSYKQILILLPEAMRTESIKECVRKIAESNSVEENSLHFKFYTDDPIKALEDGIYSYYMPDVISDTIKAFYQIVTVFSDYESDAYIIDATDHIDELFD